MLERLAHLKLTFESTFILYIKYEVKPKKPVVGSALHVSLPPDLGKGDKVTIDIAYATTHGCTALQWLDKE